MSNRLSQKPMLGHILQWRILVSLFFCLALALAPSLAEARAGSSSSGAGSSMGSRGTRTFDNNGAAPLSRSMTQTPSATSSLAGAGAAGGGSFFQRHPFMSGLAGGFLGSMLFSGMGGFGHAFGGLLTLLIIGLLIFFVIRLFSGRGFSFAGAGGGVPRSVGAAAVPQAQQYRGHDTTVGEARSERQGEAEKQPQQNAPLQDVPEHRLLGQSVRHGHLRPRGEASVDAPIWGVDAIGKRPIASVEGPPIEFRGDPAQHGCLTGALGVPKSIT